MTFLDSCTLHDERCVMNLRTRIAFAPIVVGLALFVLSAVNVHSAVAAQDSGVDNRLNGLENRIETRLTRIEARLDNQLLATFGVAVAGGGGAALFTGRRRRPHGEPTNADRTHKS